MDFEKEIREQLAQGATESQIFAGWLKSYENEEMDFNELMDRTDAYNRVFGKAYDVSPLESEEEGDGDEVARADELFGMKSEDEEEEKEEEQLSMMEDKKNDIGRS